MVLWLARTMDPRWVSCAWVLPHHTLPATDRRSRMTMTNKWASTHVAPYTTAYNIMGYCIGSEHPCCPTMAHVKLIIHSYGLICNQPLRYAHAELSIAFSVVWCSIQYGMESDWLPINTQVWGKLGALDLSRTRSWGWVVTCVSGKCLLVIPNAHLIRV